MRAIVLASTALALVSTASAQTVEDRLNKARTEVNATQNAADRALYAIKKPDVAKATTEINATKNAASRALYAIDKALEAVKGTTEPPTPPPPPPPPPVEVVTLSGLPPVQSEFYWHLGTKPYSIPVSADPDVVGAFRFLCGSAGLGRFDPIVYPGDHTGKSHLHNFYGNTGVNPDSTYASLRTSGKSTCGYGPYPLNRSSYWTAAMLDGRGNVLEVDYAAVYYKRRPASDPVVSDPNNPRYQGKAVPLPNGLRFIFGYDMLSGTPAPGVVDYVLQDPTNWAVFSNNGAGWPSIKAVAASGKARAGLQLIRRLHAPSCWNGKQVDSPDHRSHLSYPKYGSWGYPKCDAEHPYVLPEYQLQEVYTIGPDDDLAKWGASSDAMHPEAEDTSHADFFMAWDPNARDDWEANCLNKKLNCSAGNMGGGRAIDAAQSKYPDASGNLVAMNKNPYRIKPIPGPEANDRIIGPKY